MKPFQRPYLTGKCFDFALALAEQAAEPKFVAIGDARWPEHVGLRVGDDLYADVRGVMELSEFLAHHAATGAAVVAAERDDVALHCGLSGRRPPYKGNRDIAEARRAVRLAFPDGLQAAVELALARRAPPSPS